MKVTVSDLGYAAGRAAKLYTISDGELAVSVTDYGATVADIVFSGKNGPVRAALGYASAEGYEKGSSFLGATVGRYAGRIGGAAFTLNGRTYPLSKNDGENHLHGSFSRRYWEPEITGDGVCFRLESPDGDEGFPGRLLAAARFSVTGGVFRIVYEAEAESDTVVNLTNHSYFNLNGSGSVSEHMLSVNSDEYAELGEGNIPTGRILMTSGSALCFSAPRPLAEAINDPRLKTTRGLDHSFILPGEGMRDAARVYSPLSGVELVCRTTAPTVHIYTAGFLGGDTGGTFSNGEAPSCHAGVCLETQSLPDSPNKPGFPSTVLRAGGRFRSVTEYRFRSL